MAQALQTKCPACETTFALTPEQLAARDGLVRCGRCSIVFRADRYLVQAPAKRARAKTRSAPGRARGPKASAARQAPEPPVKQPVKQKTKPPAAPPPEQPQTPEAEFVSPLLARLLGGRRGSRTASVLWGAGASLLTLVLAAQLVFFYASELARYHPLAPWVAAACAHLGCKIEPRRNVALIELLRTSVAPHPREANALRVRLAMVNRAGFIQPYPHVELSLTDSTGALVARRTFAPRQYLPAGDTAAGMVPHLVVEGRLDVTSPDPRPGGYEIRLVVP